MTIREVTVARDGIRNGSQNQLEASFIDEEKSKSVATTESYDTPSGGPISRLDFSYPGTSLSSSSQEKQQQQEQQHTYPMDSSDDVSAITSDITRGASEGPDMGPHPGCHTATSKSNSDNGDSTIPPNGRDPEALVKIAATCKSIGDTANAQGNYDKALQMYQKALDALTEVFGEAHPDVPTTLHSMGDVLTKQGKLDKANEVYERELAIQLREVHGGDVSDKVGVLDSNPSDKVGGFTELLDAEEARSLQPPLNAQDVENGSNPSKQDKESDRRAHDEEKKRQKLKCKLRVLVCVILVIGAGVGIALAFAKDEEPPPVVECGNLTHPAISKGTTYPLSKCQGDCDNDLECSDGLMCYQRDVGQPVPGCSCWEDDQSAADYCIDASKPVNPTFTYPLGRCEGDCDTDGDCEIGHGCFQRSFLEAVPYCSGGSYDTSNNDYCIPLFP